MQHCCLSACFFVLDKENKMLRWTDSDIQRHYKPVNPISRGNQSRTPYIWLQALNLICTSKLKKLKKFPCLSFFFFHFQNSFWHIHQMKQSLSRIFPHLGSSQCLFSQKLDGEWDLGLRNTGIGWAFGRCSKITSVPDSRKRKNIVLFCVHFNEFWKLSMSTRITITKSQKLSRRWDFYTVLCKKGFPFLEWLYY